MHGSLSSPKTTSRSTEPLEVTVGGRHAVVRKNETHPDAYLFIDIDGKRFFLGVLVPGMTRRDVRTMATRWLQEHRRQFAP